MCGIWGYTGNISTSLALSALNKLTHRGPDGHGLWQSEAITLGHRRLAILDLTEKANQPMSYANERYWITYNGELYNFLEIKEELKKKGCKFRTESDTEVILAAFCEWQENCLKKFNGMWAFAIWDSQEKTLFLSRDRFGKKPLFYSFLPHGFAFASEMKAIFPLLDEVRPNRQLIKDTHRLFQYETTEECLIEDIKRFPSGHYGWLKNGNLSTHRYWCTLDNLIEVPERYEEQVEQFRDLFIDACRIRMRSDVPIGTALSGGLDSSSIISTVAHIARSESGNRLSQDWQHAFVASFPGTPLDERCYAEMVTKNLDIDATFLEIDPVSSISRLNDFLYLFEDLYNTSPIPFMLTYEAMKKQGIKVTIDGHGADECFGGYHFDFLSALDDAAFNLSDIRMILDTYQSTFAKDSKQFKLPPKLITWTQWQLVKIARQVLKKKKKKSKDELHSGWHKLDHLSKKLYISTHDSILPTLLRNYDRYSMANGVEIRMPFLDYRIVCFAFSLPWSSKIRKGFSKAIIRDAAAPFMPHDIAYRKSKIGFNTPIVDWMKGPLKTFFLDTIHSESFQKCSLIDTEKTREKINFVIQDPAASFSDGVQAWSMINPYFWEQAVIKPSK